MTKTIRVADEFYEFIRKEQERTRKSGVYLTRQWMQNGKRNNKNKPGWGFKV